LIGELLHKGIPTFMADTDIMMSKADKSVINVGKRHCSLFPGRVSRGRLCRAV